MKFTRTEHTKEEAVKVFNLWYKGAIVLEIGFLIEVGALLVSNAFFHFALALFLLISTVFIHIAIQLGSIDLQLAELSEKYEKE